MNRINLILIFGITLSTNLFADFRIVSIDGGGISSSKNTSVSIEKEYVKVKLYRDTCRVICKFWVKSTVADESLHIAFPNSLADYSFGSRISQGVEAFSVSVDDSTVKYLETTDKTLLFGKFHDNLWFSFDIHILKNKVHVIECTYKDKWYGIYQYLIGTAITWNGPILKGQVVFDFSPICSDLFVQKPVTYIHDMPTEDFKLNLTGNLFHDSLVYFFENYKPDSNEIVAIRIFPFWKTFSGINHHEDNPIFYDQFSDMLLYSPTNSFLYEYLSDTLRYKHDYNFAAVRDELLSRVGFRGLNRYPFFSGNLDSLKTDLLRTKELQAKFVLDSLKVTNECKNERINTKIREEISHNLTISSEHLEKFKNVFRDTLSGPFEIQ